jgi:DNA mismatch endonuclease Vsr
MKRMPTTRPSFSDVPDGRRRNMAAVRGRDTQPELRIRRMLHALGYRFRLQRRDLPGRPDIVFPARRKVLFVHGCFWHRHGCRNSVLPKTRTEWWTEKLSRNVARDHAAVAALEALGWSVLTVWECQAKDGSHLSETILAFLGPPGLTAAGAVLSRRS